MIVHIVMFKFKDENKEIHLHKVQKALNGLVHKIKEIKFIEVGINFKLSERAFDLSLYTKFDTKEDLQTYATHPAHLEVITLIKNVTEESKVVDYQIDSMEA